MLIKLKKLGIKIAITLTSLLLLNTPIIAAEWSEIQQRGKLIIAVKSNLPPLGFRDGEGNLQGLEIDIARRLAQELLGNPEAVIFVPVNNLERLSSVIDGKVDLAIAQITANTSRSRIVDFSDYYYLDGTSLITKNKSIQSLKDLASGKIAVIKDSDTLQVIRYQLPQAQLIEVDTYQAAYLILETGEADAFASDQSILTGWQQKYPAYHLLPVRLSVEPLGIVMPRGLQYSELRIKVNQAISRWQESGWLQERINYYRLP